MAKRIFIALQIVIFSYALSAQEDYAKWKFGLTYSSFGNNTVITSKDLVGAAGYDGNGFYTLGVIVNYSQCSCADFETGIEYSKHKIIVMPNLPPDMDNTPYNKQLNLINIPFTLKVNLAKYFFIRGGILIDIDAGLSGPINNQSGIGGGLGAGVQYPFKFGMNLFADVYAKYHAWISFSPKDSTQRLAESGVRFGVMYKIK